MRDNEKAFIEINPDFLNIEINNRSVSGVGSQLDNGTKNIRENLYNFLKKWDVHSIFDIPCGDFWWMKTIDLQDIEYIGGDIIEKRINHLNSLYPNKQFLYFNLIDDTNFPKVDLIFCRDLMFHLSNADKRKAIENFINSGIPYILMSNHPNSNKNEDIKTSSFAFINWQLPPWNISLPIDILYDSNSGYDTKEMQLYTREQIIKSLLS